MCRILLSKNASCTCSPSGCRTVRVVWCGLCVSFSRDQTWCACIYVPPVCIYLLMCKWRSLGFSPAATTQHHVLRRRKAQTKQEGKRVTDGQTDRLCSLPEAPDGHGRKKNERAEKKKKERRHEKSEDPFLEFSPADVWKGRFCPESSILRAVQTTQDIFRVLVCLLHTAIQTTHFAPLRPGCPPPGYRPNFRCPKPALLPLKPFRFFPRALFPALATLRDREGLAGSDRVRRQASRTWLADPAWRRLHASLTVTPWQS